MPVIAKSLNFIIYSTLQKIGCICLFLLNLRAPLIEFLGNIVVTFYNIADYVRQGLASLKFCF